MSITRQQAVMALMNATPQSPEVKVNIDATNGVLRSSKEMYLSGYMTLLPDDPVGRTYTIFHGIDGTLVDFTFDEAVEVLMGERSPWDGKVDDDDIFECEKCFNSFDIEDSIEQETGELFCPKCAGK